MMIPQMKSQIKELRKIMKMVGTSVQTKFRMYSDGLLRFNDRISIPMNIKLREKVMDEEHGMIYTVHPESTKMYHNWMGWYEMRAYY